MTTGRHPWYQITTDKSHETDVYWGDWHVYAYCKEAGCGWESKTTNHFYAGSAHHWDQAAKHTRKMNRWWRRLARKLIPNQQGAEQ